MGKMKKIDYINDKELTKLLLKEKEEYFNKERKSCSNQLAEKFLLILEKILTRPNFNRYSQDYKDEFKSSAELLFIKHWFKFNPEKIKKNYFIKNGKKILKEKKDWGGAFAFFSILAWTGCTDEIKKFKKIKNEKQQMIDDIKKEFLNSKRKPLSF